MNNIPTFTSKQILEFIEKRHAKDVVVPECKNGETWGVRDLLRLDAWVLCRSYSPLTTIGYEIKVDRHDFEQDQKWTGYLDLCHEFFFVCPAGLIRSTDLPSSIGLMWVSKAGNLYLKKRPERRTPDPVKSYRLLIYVIMARSRIVANMYEANNQTTNEGNNNDPLSYYRSVVEGARERKSLAAFIRGHIRDVWKQIEEKESDIRDKLSQVERFEQRLSRLGIVWDSAKSNWTENTRVRTEIDLLRLRMDDAQLNDMLNLAKVLESTATEIQRIRREPGFQPNPLNME